MHAHVTIFIGIYANILHVVLKYMQKCCNLILPQLKFNILLDLFS